MQTVELEFECFGEQHTGCPLLILHGFFASARNWRTIARQLSTERRVYVLDMRNHGNSPHCAQMDYPAMAADLDAAATLAVGTLAAAISAAATAGPAARGN